MKQEFYNAIWGNSLEEIKKYALEAENINSKNKKGETALMSAVHRGDSTIVEFLLTIPSLKLEVKNKYKQTALFLAAKNGDIKICDMLLKAGAKINSKDYSEGNVLFAAIQKPTCFTFLLKHNPDMHCRNGLNMSCLTYLYKDKNIALIECLVSYSKNLADIEEFHQQRTDIYNYHLKNKPSVENDKFNQQIEAVISKIKLKLDLDSDLNQKSTKIPKSKI